MHLADWTKTGAPLGRLLWFGRRIILLARLDLIKGQDLHLKQCNMLCWSPSSSMLVYAMLGHGFPNSIFFLTSLATGR